MTGPSPSAHRDSLIIRSKNRVTLYDWMITTLISFRKPRNHSARQSSSGSNLRHAALKSHVKNERKPVASRFRALLTAPDRSGAADHAAESFTPMD